MIILFRLFILLFVPSIAIAFTLISDNDIDHRYYDIIGSPYGKIRVESSGSRTGYLSIPFDLAPAGTRTLKIRAVGDNETYSDWIEFTYTRDGLDGNFTYDKGNTTTMVGETTALQRWGLTQGSH
jgi:hypothetical protein